MRGEHTPDEITQRRLKKGIVRTTQGVAEIIGIGGRLQSYWVADFDRNQWPTWCGIPIPSWTNQDNRQRKSPYF